MKTDSEIEKAISNVPSQTQYPGMTYEDGVREALEWVLGEISDDEFEYAE